MAEKIITLVEFKKLYHEDVSKENMSKNDRQKWFDEFWEKLPDATE